MSTDLKNHFEQAVEIVGTLPQKLALENNQWWASNVHGGTFPEGKQDTILQRRTEEDHALFQLPK